MKSSNFKAILITTFCFVVLCSGIKPMDTASDFQKTTSYKAKIDNNEIHLDSLKSEIKIDSHNALLTRNQNENKDQETSFVSYITSPVKAVIRGTYNEEPII